MVFSSHLPKVSVLQLNFRNPVCPLPFISSALWLQEGPQRVLHSGYSLEYSPCLWWKLFSSLLGATNILRLIMSLIVLLQAVPLENNQSPSVRVHGKLLSQLQGSELITFGQLGSRVCTKPHSPCRPREFTEYLEPARKCELKIGSDSSLRKCIENVIPWAGKMAHS